MEERSPFNLHDVNSLKCSVKETSYCLQCESCRLIERIKFSKSWFRSLGFENQRRFLEKLILSSGLMNRLKDLLFILHSKDYQYAKSRLKPSSTRDGFQSNTNHSLDENMIKIAMVDYLAWFNNSSEWTRSNYLLTLLQFCSTPLLDAIKELISMHTTPTENTSFYANHDHDHDHDHKTDQTNKQISKITSTMKCIPKCKSAPMKRNVDCTVHRSTIHDRKGLKSAGERVVFDKEVTFFDALPKNDLELVQFHNSRASSRSSNKNSRTSSRYQLTPKSNSSARCTPVLTIDSLSDVSVKICDEIYDTTLAENEKCANPRSWSSRDMIKSLPIHLAKKIFGYLDNKNLKVILCVSKLWNDIGKQVKADVKYIQARNEDVMMMKSTVAKTPHPSYARKVPVFIPRLDDNGNVQINVEGKHVDVEIINDEFEDINMSGCFDGLETKKIFMEERNMYCSSYNVLMLESRHDPNRKIYYDGGELIAIGSSDRKIQLIHANTGDRMKRICGHTGSIKCLYMDENNNILISGGYDTTIRLWNLKSGKSEVIFLGHQGTILSVTVSRQLLVSTAADCTIKIWKLWSGKCITTLTHSSVVRVHNVLGNQILTGTSNGELMTWDMKTGGISKNFVGHEDVVTCLKSNIYFVFSGSSDGFVKLWNNVGNLCTCLKTFRHPSDVLCLNICYCRLITGCSDGKIRVWNQLNGNCLRVIRGNSRNDPISQLFAFNDRLIINTVSSIIVYNFEKVLWNYSVPREHGEISKIRSDSSLETYPHSYTRAQKLLYHGSPLHKPTIKNFHGVEGNGDYIENFNHMKIGGSILGRLKNNRINSAPSRTTVSHTVSTVESRKTIDRAKSAVNVSRTLYSVDYHINRIKKNASGISSTLRNEANVEKSELCDKVMKPSIKTRCKSAPVQRVITVPQNERGVSTSSFTFDEGLSNQKIILKPKPIKKTHRPKTATPLSVVDRDLGLRTYHSQLNFNNMIGST